MRHGPRSLFLLLALAVLVLGAAADDARADSVRADSVAAGAVHVVTDGFSSWIALPGEVNRYDVYGFAQADWYLRQEQGIGGMLSTLVPGDAAVQRGRLQNLPAWRDQETVAWRIPAGPDTLAAIRQWLEASYDHTRRFVHHTEPDTGWSLQPVPQGAPPHRGWRYHPSEMDYSVWWNCHDYVLRALRIGGVSRRHWLRVVLTAPQLHQIMTHHYGDPLTPRTTPADP